MKAYKTQTTITKERQLVVSDMPFDAGEEVEIVVRAKNGDGAPQGSGLRDLFKATQSIPQAQVLSEEDIIREVEAFRNGR